MASILWYKTEGEKYPIGHQCRSTFRTEYVNPAHILKTGLSYILSEATIRSFRASLTPILKKWTRFYGTRYAGGSALYVISAASAFCGNTPIELAVFNRIIVHTVRSNVKSFSSVAVALLAFWGCTH